MNTIKANVVDVSARRIYSGEVIVDKGKIVRLNETGAENPELDYVMPGFVDAHVHTESSMLTPDEFARLAAINGTVAAVVDPHEIANVLGVDGVKYLIHNASASPFHFCFGAPSCVPSTTFETAGAVLDHVAVEQLLDMKEVTHLSEVMNVPAVLLGDPDMAAKLKAAKDRHKPIDGHAPILSEDELRKYAGNGIGTNHECTELAMAQANIAAGIDVIIRNGSAAHDYDKLHPLIATHPDNIMFCTDDCHPDALEKGPIRQMVRKSVELGYDLWNVLQAACVNPVLHYGIKSGLLREGDSADFIEVRDLKDFEVVATYIAGVRYDKAASLPVDTGKYGLKTYPNKFERGPVSEEDLHITPLSPDSIKLIEASDGSLLTEMSSARACMDGDNAIGDQSRDILKIAVLNRYDSDSKPAIGFVRGFGIKNGAIATSIAHDSHNLICIGTSDELMAKAMNAVIEMKGGMACVSEKDITALPLPVGGICSAAPYKEVIDKYLKIREAVRSLGSAFNYPFMTMSFLALPVIPWLKLTDKGLFDYKQFNLTSL